METFILLTACLGMILALIGMIIMEYPGQKEAEELAEEILKH